MSNRNYPTSSAWIIWGTAVVFYCYEYLLRILPSVMTNYLRHLFMINGLALGNLSAAYYYTYVPMQLPAGILVDRFITRNVLSLACFTCALGMYSFNSHYLYVAYCGRLLVGFGSAFAFVGVMKLATHWFPPHYFSFITGLTTSVGMLGAMLGNIALVNLIDCLGIQVLLSSTVIFGMGLAILMYLSISDNSTNTIQPNQLLTPRQYYTKVAMLLRDSQLWLLGIIGSCLFLSLTAFSEIWGIPYLVKQYGLSQQSAAYYNSFVFLGWAVGSPVMGYIGTQCNTRQLSRLISMNALLDAMIFGLMLYCSTVVKNYLSIVLLLLGVFSSAQILVFTIVRNLYTADLAGMAFAITNFIIMLGGGLSQPVIGYLLDRSSRFVTATSLVEFSALSFVYALSVIPIAFISAALLCYGVRSETLKNQ